MQTSPQVAVSGHEHCPLAQLEQLAKSLTLPLFNDAPSAQYLLHQNLNRLELLNANEPKTKAICVDFEAGKAHHRRLYGGGKGQDFSKALGLQKFPAATIVDATAGLGGDAFVMATLGCTVTMLERNTIVQQLLSDGLARADSSEDSEVQAIAAKMRLVQQQAAGYLKSLDADEYPMLIYLDPMFPQRGKSALVKKEMRFFHDIVGNDDDSGELLDIALTRAVERVIVKRPLKAETLNARKPDFDIKGKTIRYDIYLGCRHLANQRPITSSSISE